MKRKASQSPTAAAHCPHSPSDFLPSEAHEDEPTLGIHGRCGLHVGLLLRCGHGSVGVDGAHGLRFMKHAVRQPITESGRPTLMRSDGGLGPGLGKYRIRIGNSSMACWGSRLG